MRTPITLGAYALGLLAVFATALGVGRAVDPSGATATPAHSTTHGATAGGDDSDAATHLPAGLQVTEDGYRLAPLSGALTVGEAQPFRFRILGPDGAPVTRYATRHDKDLHLIVVRRDLTGFQHVHPTLDADGTWSVPLAVAQPGQYRVFTDFQPAGHHRGVTLGVDVPAAGDYQPAALPAASRTASIDGYTVTLDGDLAPGTSSKLTLSVSRGGTAVTDLQPYLGAYGHLVVLRDGDLAYLHVHPDGTPGDGRTSAGPQISFSAEVPSTGTYRLYLDFQHAGTVRTATFTATAGHLVGAPAAPPPSTAPRATTSAEPDNTGHPHG